MKTSYAVLLAIILVSCAQQKVDTKAEGEKVMQASKEWSQMASSGDIEKTVNYWADDAIMISAGEPVLNGKAAIRKMVEESFKMPGFKISWQPLSVDVSESGDMAYLVEDSQVQFADSTGKLTTVHNKAVSIWKKQKDGSWKNAVDIATPAARQ